ncbi:MAG: CD1871A family CXXC motif-containing protein [Lachnospiraceae bacterium]|nr:CD1871A family CXXC motif-containing protein [Lachnospiraceae bacterium]
MRKYRIAILGLFLSAGMIIAGLYRGEAKAVLNKATKICLECVGIG